MLESAQLAPILLLGVTLWLVLQQVPFAAACPFAAMGGAMPGGQQHQDARRLMSGGGSGSSSSLEFCKEYYQTFSKCEGSGIGSYSPSFYESKGCTGLWEKIVWLLDSYQPVIDGQVYPNFVKDCLPGLIRNVFHMDIGTGHNGMLLLEDYGSVKHLLKLPKSDPNATRSAKYAEPNQTLRCYDIYEYLRQEVDKYTSQSCKKLYVSCTDLANYVAKYAHWKLSDKLFFPCFNFGFADMEPTDFNVHPLLKAYSPRTAAEHCLPPHDGTDTTPPSLEAKDFNTFFNTAYHAFSKPCYSTISPMSDDDLANILMGHTVGESHCFHIQLETKDPFQNDSFFNKLKYDCNRCRKIMGGVQPGPVPPMESNFAVNLNNNSYSFAQPCKTAGQKDYLPVGKTSGIDRVKTYLKTFYGKHDPCCVPNDVFTPFKFDYFYWPQVVGGYGLFEVDNALPKHNVTKDLTLKWARCNETLNLFKEYQDAWNKMNLIGAKPWDGKRREYCSVPTWKKFN